ncbi:DNA-directed RNA polymerase subunit beta like [Actinidia chinensis var. chinensis]|uniref:DNA-directed RNA polymerase subunit beta like n=1 Tax=Actinidia chinensis var. chinensis TaxID=1590841 RepID=A0A2R6QLX6_ACTCC|nr:DNA-directed RNA polymerase subunit beta like [Actinidia chinensis var. chinensis]
MGNFLGCKSSMVWEGDEWESIETMELPKREEQSLVGENTEVKIKITKKQLEELLARVEAHDMSVNQVLSSLINGDDHFEIQHQRSWRPSLQSIPEVDNTG